MTRPALLELEGVSLLKHHLTLSSQIGRVRIQTDKLESASREYALFALCHERLGFVNQGLSIDALFLHFRNPGLIDGLGGFCPDS